MKIADYWRYRKAWSRLIRSHTPPEFRDLSRRDLRRRRKAVKRKRKAWRREMVRWRHEMSQRRDRTPEVP